MDKEKIFSATEKVFDSLYAKGDFDYEITTSKNKSWFGRRVDTTAYIIEIHIPINLQKILPTSKEYDPNYRKALERAREGADDIKKYIGEPNLVIIVEYEWAGDNQEYTQLNVDFQKMSIEIAENFINNPDNRKELNFILNGDVTAEKFFQRFDFGVYPTLWDSDPTFEIEAISHSAFCRWFDLEIMIDNFILPVLDKYGFKEGEYDLKDSLCTYDDL